MTPVGLYEPSKARAPYPKRFSIEVPAGMTMDDSLEPGPNWQLIQNAFYRDGGLHQRPGLVEAGTSGSAGEGIVVIHPHTVANGTRYIFMLRSTAGGYKLLRAVWATNTTLTITDVSPGAATIPTASLIGPLKMLSFSADQILVGSVSSVALPPIMFTNLTAANVTQTTISLNTAGTMDAGGIGAVYGSKAFFINANSPPSEIVWSEEADPTLGYEQNSYNNSWNLIQTSPDPVVWLVGTNNGLVYFRPTSIGHITGTVSSDFATTATIDGISESIGAPAVALNSAAFLRHQGDIWFVDNLGTIRVLALGGGPPKDIGVPFSNTIAALAAAYVGITSQAHFTYLAELDLILCVLGTSSDSRILVFGATTYQACGVWNSALVPGSATGPFFQSAATVPGLDGNPVVLLATKDNITGQASKIYRIHDAGNAGAGADGSSAIDVNIVGPAVDYDRATEKRFDKLTAGIRVTTDTDLVRDIRLDYRTPRATYGTVQTVTVTAQFDGAEVQGTVGTNGFGRWIRPRYRSSASTTNDGKHAFTGFRVEGIVTTAAPGIR